MRKIVIIIGSKSDLPQCRAGLQYLKTCGSAQVVGVYVRSQHRNTLETQELLKKLSQEEIDVAIIGAGWANHLTGCCDAFLRYTLQNTRIVVIGVAFADPENEKHTQAAALSMSEVPGTKVKYEDDRGVFVGLDGFARACIVATEKLPEITLPSPKEPLDLTLTEALQIAAE